MPAIKERIRAKNGSIRILMDEGEEASQVSYVSVEPKTCWSETFKGWGKASPEGAYVEIDNKRYVVTLQPV